MAITASRHVDFLKAFAYFHGSQNRLRDGGAFLMDGNRQALIGPPSSFLADRLVSFFGEHRTGSIVPKSRPEEVWDNLFGERCMVTFFIY